MLKLFIDSSVFFEMADKPKSDDRKLFRLALRGQVELVVSNYVFDETEYNLGKKRPTKVVATFQRLRSQTRFWTIVDATKDEVLAAIASKCTPDIADMPIIAAAKRAKVDALVSNDKRHILRQSVANYIEGIVATPEQIIKRLEADQTTTE